MSRPGQLRADWMTPHQLRAYHQRRAGRATVLKPWRGECLVLRSEDTRLPPGDPVPVAQAGARGSTQGPIAQAAPSIPAMPAMPPVPTIPRRPRDAVAAERITVDADLIARLCTWPHLPELCTMKQASRLLGVSYSTLGRWVRAGLLLRRRERGQGRGNRWYVSYRPTSPLVRRTTGQRWRYPEGFFRGLADPPAVAWVVDLWRRDTQAAHGAQSGRRQVLVRVRTRRAGVPPRGGNLRWEWLCPACGRRCYQVYVPAGPMARRGMVWRAEGAPPELREAGRGDRALFRCWRCTGVESEGGCWSNGEASMLHRYLLKLTGGVAGRHEFARVLAGAPLPGEA